MPGVRQRGRDNSPEPGPHAAGGQRAEETAGEGPRPDLGAGMVGRTGDVRRPGIAAAQDVQTCPPLGHGAESAQAFGPSSNRGRSAGDLGYCLEAHDKTREGSSLPEWNAQFQRTPAGSEWKSVTTPPPWRWKALRGMNSMGNGITAFFPGETQDDTLTYGQTLSLETARKEKRRPRRQRGPQ